jgi:hypothetical protein
MYDEPSEIIDVTATSKVKDPTKESVVKEPAKPGLLDRFATYVRKNQENNRKLGLKPLSEELGGAGANWMGGMAKGMAAVGDEFEAEVTGKKKKQPVQQRESTMNRGRGVTNEGDPDFVEELCSFLRFVQEDDEVMLWQHRGNKFQIVDNTHLSKLLTRYSGHKVTIKERDLMFK